MREDIARMSSKPMLKVQEDVTALRQLLSVVATGLQRNACSVEKLKLEMTQVRADLYFFSQWARLLNYTHVCTCSL